MLRWALVSTLYGDVKVCAAGVNRSGLVVALALVMDGVPAREAVREVRERRRPAWGMVPLSNPHFVELVERAARGRPVF